MINASDDDMKLLISKSFILVFDTGVIVIKHWRLNNYIQKDRYKKSVYSDEMNQLDIKENGAYTFCIQDVYTDKVSIDKKRIDNNSLEKANSVYNDTSFIDDLVDSEFVEITRKGTDNVE